MKRIAMMVFGVVLLSVVLFGLTDTGSAAGKRGGTLVAAINHAPRHFNASVQSGIATMLSSAQIFASPLYFDGQWKPHPYLAKSWKISEDGLSVTLKLVEGATFHDGHPITSEDVAFSMMTIKANHPFKTMLGPVERVDTPDPQTAVIRLAHPHPPILLAMSQPLCPIIPKHVFGDGQDVKTHPMNLKPIGSGPFKFVEYKPGEHLILERYENFFIKGTPYLDRFILKIIPDSVNRLMAFEQKEIQMDVFLSNARDIKRLQKKGGRIKVEPMGEAVGPIIWLAFNLLRKPLDDKRVRQAIAYAIDRDFLLKRILLGVTIGATGPIFPGTPMYSADVEKYDLDLDKANALLDKAGFPKGSDGKRFSISIDYVPAGPDPKATCEYMKAQLKKVGIDVAIRPSPDFPTWAKRVATWDFDMTLDSVWNWGDPLIGVHRTYLTSNIRKGVIWSNTQNYRNPKVDALLAKASMEPDLAKRKALYAEFQKIVVDEAPVAYLTASPFYLAYDKSLRNVNTTIWGSISPIHEVYFEK